jgi:hypothetical protein
MSTAAFRKNAAAVKRFATPPVMPASSSAVQRVASSLSAR